MNSKKPGVDDPYDWIGWWSDLHHSESFYPDLTRLLEQFPGGRILHVVSIRSNGDPLPPFV